MRDDTGHFTIQWHDAGREPQVAPNPSYPDGIDLNIIIDPTEPHCIVRPPYPAKRCGLYRIRCQICGYQIAITTAGRADDPRSVTIPCRQRKLLTGH